MNRLLRPLVALLLVTLFAGCASSRLGEHDFADRTVAVVVSKPPAPEIDTSNWLWIDPDNILASVARAGAAIAKEASADRARERMMRAMEEVDVATRVADRTLERTALYLRATPHETEHDADYVLDVWIHNYGIQTESWDSAVYFRMKADVILLDGATGDQIWKERVKTKDPLTTIPVSGYIAEDVLTAQALARLSEDEMIVAFERLADATADRIARELRDDLRKARQ